MQLRSKRWMNAVAAGAVLTALAVSGCGEPDDDQPASPSSPPPATPTPVPRAEAAPAADKSGSAGSSALPSLETARDAVRTGATDTVNAAREDMNRAVQSANVAGAVDTAAVSRQVQQAIEYVKQNKLELADTTLRQAEAHRASLPQSVQGQLDGARRMLDQAKAAAAQGTGGTNVPAGATTAPATP